VGDHRGGPCAGAPGSRGGAGGPAEVFLAKTEWAHGVEKQVVVKRILPQLVEDCRRQGESELD